MDGQTSFSTWLRQRRSRLGLTQAELAEQVGCSTITIRKLESDDRSPSERVAVRLAACLGIPAAERPAFIAFARGGRPGAAEHSPAHEPGAPALAAWYPGQLPVPLTSLINRVDESAAVGELLARADVRLLTLVGPPGIGKTRLSVQVASELCESFAGGIVFVALAPVYDPAQVLPTIARALGITETGDQTLNAALTSALRDREMLLVLDNFEQILAAAPLVADLLGAAPGLKALVTSRAALRVAGECLYAVPPLGLPDPRVVPPLAELAACPAVRLFVERVRALKPDFALTTDNAPLIAEICARLDGLPLAIELAAARGSLFTPRMLLEQLRGPAGSTALHFLVSGPRDLPTHQRTLRSTLDWSYQLLSTSEQSAFAGLGVFAGGCTAEAAQMVMRDWRSEIEDGSAQSLISNLQSPILDRLMALVDQSLVIAIAGQDGAARFNLLETIREYALERLASAGMLEPARRRHAAYYGDLAHCVGARFPGADEKRWLDRLQADYDNLRAALEWYSERDIEAGLHCAADLRYFWHVRGYLNEGRAWLARLLAEPAAAHCTAPTRARALHAAGALAYEQGDRAQAAALAEESLALYRTLGDQAGIISALSIMGRAAYAQADYQRARALYGECLALQQARGDSGGIARTLTELAMITKDQGDYTRARALLDESMALYQQVGNQRGVAYALINLSIVAYWQGDYSRAAELGEAALRLHREMDDRMGVAYALDQIGMSACKQGQVTRGLQLLAEALELFRALGDKLGMAMILCEMGSVVCTQGDRHQAARLQRDTIAMAWRIGQQRRLAFALEGLAAAVGPEQPLWAARLLGAAERLRESIGAPLPPGEQADYARALAAIRTSQDDLAFAAAWAAGRDEALERIVTEVLEE